MKDVTVSAKLETIEPVGLRVLIRKDKDKKATKGGLILPDSIEIPVLTGRILSISAQVKNIDHYPIKTFDKVIFNPSQSIPVSFELDNELFIVPVTDVVGVFRSTTADEE